MIKRWFIGFLLLLSLVGILRAQDATQPLILVKAGDLWEWTGSPTLRQKTQWGYNSQLVLSPTNDEVAYNSLPQMVVDWFKSQPGGGGDSPLPSNIWVITTQTSDAAYRIADQPADASFMLPNVAGKSLARANPFWSPDGTQIAWAEQNLSGDQTYRLMVYDKASQTTRTLADGLPQQMGLGTYFEGIWTEQGIVMVSHALSDTSPTGTSATYMLFDPVTGEKKFDIAADRITVKDDTLDPRITFPIQYQGKTWLAVGYFGQKTGPLWKLIDLDTGQFTGETANIVGYASGHAETSLRVIPVFPPNKIGYYVIQQANGAIVQLNTDPKMVTSHFALSPDGNAVAYQLHNIDNFESNTTVYIWRDGVITTVPQTEFPAIISDFVWGSITWEVGGEGPGIGAPGS
jgi:hypothetical protein